MFVSSYVSLTGLEYRIVAESVNPLSSSSSREDESFHAGAIEMRLNEGSIAYCDIRCIYLIRTFYWPKVCFYYLVINTIHSVIITSSASNINDTTTFQPCHGNGGTAWRGHFVAPFDHARG